MCERRKILNVAKRGQVVLEIALFLPFIAGMLVMAWYYFSLFDISQKQTMLVRTQAFIELGNYSNYGAAAHGKDDVKNKNSQVIFRLGRKTAGTMVDMEKVKTFSDAMKGELEVDVNAPTKEDPMWSKYRFPKGETKLIWQNYRNAKPLIEISLEQTLGIAHNRSIDLDRPTRASDRDFAATGMYTGSLHLNDLSKLQGIMGKIPPLKGFTDNRDALKARIREIAKNDPSLSNEARKLESSIDGSNFYNSGAIAAAIAAAIQIAMAAGADSLSQLFGKIPPPPSGAEGVASAGASTAAGSGGNVFSNFMNGITQNPLSLGGSFVDGTAFGPLNMLVAPVMVPAEGFKQLGGSLSEIGSGGLKGLAQAGTPAFKQSIGLIADTGQGVYQIGQGVKMGAGFAGEDLGPGFDITMAAFGAPANLIKAGDKIGMNLNEVNAFTQVGNLTGAFQELMVPAVQIVSAVAPDLAAPLALVNSATGIVSGVSSLGSAFTNPDFAAGGNLFKDMNMFQKIGFLTTTTGAVVAGIETISGKSPTVGGYMMMGGGAMFATGTVAKEMAAIKTQQGGIAGFAERSGKWFENKLGENIQNGMSTLTNVPKALGEAANSMKEGVGALMNPQFTNAKGLNISGLREVTDSGIHQMVSRTNTQEQKMNYLYDGMNKSLATMEANGVSKEVILETRNKWMAAIDAQVAIGDMSKKPAGWRDPVLEARIDKGIDAVQKLKNDLTEFTKSNPMAQQHLKAMRSGSRNAAELINNAIYNDKTVKEIGEMEKARAQNNPFAVLAAVTTGARASNKAVDKQLEELTNLEKFSRAEKNIADAMKQWEWENKQAMKAVNMVETGTFNWISKEDAAKLATRMREEVKDRKAISDRDEKRMEDAAAKLDQYAAGQWRSMSPEQELKYYARVVAEREEYFERIRAGLDEAFDDYGIRRY